MYSFYLAFGYKLEMFKSLKIGHQNSKNPISMQQKVEIGFFFFFWSPYFCTTISFIFLTK